ncbi:hypothetical protein ACFQY9_36915 [Microvirga aerilata]|uniref:hypothetical protein n=1 Tax=Microvirga aerilata TaxID=670292 RepID=UPI00362D1E17
MFSLRHFAYATVFLLMHAGSSSAHPDFNVDEIDVDQQLAFLPLPPEPEFIETSAILDVDARSNALKDRSTYLPSITHEAAANGIPQPLWMLWCGSRAGTIQLPSAVSARSG